MKGAGYDHTPDTTHKVAARGPGVVLARMCFACNTPKLTGAKNRRTGMWYCTGCRPEGRKP